VARRGASPGNVASRYLYDAGYVGQVSDLPRARSWDTLTVEPVPPEQGITFPLDTHTGDNRLSIRLRPPISRRFRTRRFRSAVSIVNLPVEIPLPDRNRILAEVVRSMRANPIPPTAPASRAKNSMNALDTKVLIYAQDPRDPGSARAGRGAKERSNRPSRPPLPPSAGHPR
jgi:hypothetical protein